MNINIYSLLQILCITCLTACSTFSYHPSNLNENQVASIHVGMTIQDFNKISSSHPFSEDTLENGSRVQYFTADYQSGSMIWCRTLAVNFSRGVVAQKVFLTGSNQDRCNAYSAASRANSESWSTFANQTSQAIEQVNTPARGVSGEQFCHYNDMGTKGYCYFSLSQCKQSISAMGGGFCTFEKN